MIQPNSEGHLHVISRDCKQTSCVLWAPFADREHSTPLAYEDLDFNMILEAESEDSQPSTRNSGSVIEGPDLSMIPDVWPSSLSMPSTARSEIEDYELNAEEDTQSKKRSQRKSRLDSESEVHDDARVGNGTIETEEYIKLEERSSIGTSHESGETWQPSFKGYSWP